MFKLKAENISQRFGERRLFSDLNLELGTGESLAIMGPNGSGKSTLLQILLGLLRPTAGEVSYFNGDSRMDPGERRSRVGFVAPYLSLYDQLSGEENLRFFAGLSGQSLSGKQIDRLLAAVGLEGRGHDSVGHYSSGMKQRLKYAVALRADPQWLFLDEPTANLDDEGKKIVVSIVDTRRKGCVIVVATNEEREGQLADQVYRLG